MPAPGVVPTALLPLDLLPLDLLPLEPLPLELLPLEPLPLEFLQECPQAEQHPAHWAVPATAVLRPTQQAMYVDQNGQPIYYQQPVDAHGVPVQMQYVQGPNGQQFLQPQYGMADAGGQQMYGVPPHIWAVIAIVAMMTVVTIVAMMTVVMVVVTVPDSYGGRDRYDRGDRGDRRDRYSGRDRDRNDGAGLAVIL